MKMFYGGMFMPKEKLREEGILYPIKLEYYKLNEEENYQSNYGIEIIKTSYIENKSIIERNKITNITKEENKINELLETLKKNEVTPISMEDIIEDIMGKNINLVLQN